MRTVETSAAGLADQLDLGKLTALRNQPGRLAAGSTVVYRTRIGGSLKIDNQTVTFDSPSRTVDELLQSYNVTLGGDDYVVPPIDTVLADGASVEVVRVGAAVSQDTRKIPFDTVRAGRPRPPHRPDPRDAAGQGRHDGGHLPPAGRERRPRVTARSSPRCRRWKRSPRSSGTAPTPIRTGTSSRSASREAAGAPSTAAPNGYDGGLGIYRGTWRAYGGTEFAPNAGLATREQQIIVGMRIYADLGWDPWGCANNVLHWPQWSM